MLVTSVSGRQRLEIAGTIFWTEAGMHRIARFYELAAVASPKALFAPVIRMFNIIQTSNWMAWKSDTLDYGRQYVS